MISMSGCNNSIYQEVKRIISDEVASRRVSVGTDVDFLSETASVKIELPSIFLPALTESFCGSLPRPSKVIFHDPATVVMWDDGTKTVVMCRDGDAYSRQTGFLMCVAKRAFGNSGKWLDVLREFGAQDDSFGSE